MAGFFQFSLNTLIYVLLNRQNLVRHSRQAPSQQPRCHGSFERTRYVFPATRGALNFKAAGVSINSNYGRTLHRDADTCDVCLTTFQRRLYAARSIASTGQPSRNKHDYARRIRDSRESRTPARYCNRFIWQKGNLNDTRRIA